MKGFDGKVITVDGPAASGKSTVARKLAQGLGFRYVNSGAFYRTFALALARQAVRLDDAAALDRALDAVTVRVGPEGEQTFLGDEDVTEFIRTKEVSEWASKAAALTSVRSRVNRELRRLAAQADCVIDGRDIGSVVFPQADFKLYLEASLEERSRRRLEDYQRAGRQAALEDIQAELAERDRADSSRQLDPLRLPSDALVVNSTNQSVDAIVRDLLARIQEVFSAEKHDFPQATAVGLNL